jgi:hydrogenase/urease accessory protein HupE
MVLALPATHAHQPGLSTVFLDLGTNRISAQLILAWQELQDSAPLDANADGVLSESELAAQKNRLQAMAEAALSLESDGRMLALKSPPEIHADDTTGVRFNIVFEFPTTSVLTLHSEILSELRPSHRQIVTVRDPTGGILGEAVLERERPTLDIPLSAGPPGKPPSPARDFFILGLEHIVAGWDHLAFLFGLLAIGGRLRDAVKIITSFTVAHSLTLALATFNLIRIPSSIVEPIIAASIIYVGFENIVRRNFEKRWMLTFAFGLIHGCGFASVLRDIGLGADGRGVAMPLVFFNLGVEAGQILIAAIMLPIIWRLKRAFPKRWVPVASAVLIVIGSYFLVDRIWPRSESAGHALPVQVAASATRGAVPQPRNDFTRPMTAPAATSHAELILYRNSRNPAPAASTSVTPSTTAARVS